MSRSFSVMRIIGDHAVLQSGSENRIFGYAAPGAQVSLTITGGSSVSLTAAADEKGRWVMTVPAFPASFLSCTFSFVCGNETTVFTDILFGELFHISGQSNMELPMYRTADPLKPEKFPVCEHIREFRVPIDCRFGKDEEYEDFRGGEWKTANDENVPEMSAVGFYFALSIYRRHGVPVGLLNSSAGGAPIEGRMPYSMLSELGWYDDFLAECTAPGYVAGTEKADRERNEQRSAQIESADRISAAIFGDTAEYGKCTVPIELDRTEGLEGFCGRIWFRKTFEIPEDADISGAVLILGTLTDADRTYLNGRLVGETGYMYPPRIYPLPENILVHGKNTVHVCLDVIGCHGGFTKGKTYCIKLKDRLVDISGEWEYAAAARVPAMKRDTFFPGLPLAVYGAMTAPAFNVNCRALIWYQGESNCYKAERYPLLFRKFTEMYRRRCGRDIPVIFAQLCNFDDPFAGGSDCWAQLRARQLECLAVPGTDMAVTIDLGESNDLHPRNKAEVGRRLARCAERTIYGDKTVLPDIFCVGADTLGCENGTGRVLLRFTDNSRIRLENDAEKCFDICFSGKTQPALSAELTENGIVVSFASSEMPETIRCEWANDPQVIGLRDTEGLPLSPFKINVGQAVTK